MATAQAETRTNFVTHWITGTFIGWIFGVLTLFLAPAIWEILTTIAYQYFQEAVWYEALSGWLGDIIFYLLSLGALFLMGIVIGLAQWQIALKDKVNRRLWAFSSGLSSTIGAISLIIGSRIAPTPFSFHSGNYSGLDATLSVNETWFITVFIFGSLFGIAIGLPKWLLLRTHFYQTHYWLLGHIVTGVATFGWIVAVVSVLKNVVISLTLICCTIPIVLSAISGMALYSLLQHSKYAETK